MLASQPNVEARLGAQFTSEQQSYFDTVLAPSIDAYISLQTGVQFGSTESIEVYVDGEGTNRLIIPTMHDITAVHKVNDDGTEEVVPIQEYRTYPAGKPDSLALTRTTGTWAEGSENYKVTGEIGYKNVPADLVEVATEMAVLSLNANINNYKSEKVGDWSVTYSDAAKSLSSTTIASLDSYKRLSRSL